jgi:hypothetical protein
VSQKARIGWKSCCCVVVNTTSGWPRPHRLLFFRPPSCGLSSSILSGPSFSIFFLYLSPSYSACSLPFHHHHTGPVHFSLPCLFSKFCPFYNHLNFSISPSKEPRWLIVYAVRYSNSFVATYSRALCHMSWFVSYHCETGLVSNAPRTSTRMQLANCDRLSAHLCQAACGVVFLV